MFAFQLKICILGITQGHDVQLKNFWGHVNFVARGEGQALAQLGRRRKNKLVPDYDHSWQGSGSGPARQAA